MPVLVSNTTTPASSRFARSPVCTAAGADAGSDAGWTTAGGAASSRARMPATSEASVDESFGRYTTTDA